MKKTKVLIADDNESLLLSLQIQLRAHGYEVVTCENADLAVAYAEKHTPNIMLADIWMDADRRMILSPMGNGLGLVERIGKIPGNCGIPIIYITGDNSPQLDLRAKELGAYGLIRKPINIAALMKMIDSAAKASATCSCASADTAANGELQISAAPQRSNIFEV